MKISSLHRVKLEVTGLILGRQFNFRLSLVYSKEGNNKVQVKRFPKEDSKDRF
jgi:hypothetical protein